MSSKDYSYRRVLAIHLGSRGFGYAVLESPHIIIDWGSKSIRKGRTRTALAKAARLLDQYSPDVLVVEDTQSKCFSRRKRVAQLLLNLKEVAGEKHILTCVISRLSVRNVFLVFEARTRRETAGVVADKLPALSPLLRDSRRAVFDAAALGIAYFYTRRAVASCFPGRSA